MRELARRRGRWSWGVLALGALSVGIVVAVMAHSSPDPRSIVLSRTVATPSLSANVKLAKVLNVPFSRPVRLVIPSIGVNTSVGTLGLQANHEVMVPTSTHVVGWYKDGPTPGRVGSSVILGHVDSYTGPGVFFYLKSLKAGDAIVVTLADGAVTHFRVTSVVQYSKSSFPDRLVYGSHGVRALQLVTCGGTFDHQTGHYESNVVVFSRLVKVSLPKR